MNIVITKLVSVLMALVILSNVNPSIVLQNEKNYSDINSSKFKISTENEILNTASYTVSFWANGGYSVPGAQTKLFDETIYISSNIPKKNLTVFF